MPDSLSLTRVLNPNPGWYSGDFHCHTNFSDGYYDPVGLLDVARMEGLDFFFVTDHNTLDEYPHFGDPEDVLVLPGIEVTFRSGHFNVFGIQGWSEWMDGICDGDPIDRELGGRMLSEVMVQTHAAGLLNSINHSCLKPWHWQDGLTDLRCVHCLEIWNDPSWPENRLANPEAIRLWTKWLNAGYRITAIGGSDYHEPEPRPDVYKPAERLGLPRTYVCAQELSGAAILTAVREQHVYVTMGPRVTFTATALDRTFEIGDDAGRLAGGVVFSGMLTECPEEARVQIVRNGAVVVERKSMGEDAAIEWEMQAEADEAVWVRLDVYDPDGLMLATSNPIFFGPRSESDRYLYGDFVNTSRIVSE